MIPNVLQHFELEPIITRAATTSVLSIGVGDLGVFSPLIFGLRTKMGAGAQLHTDFGAFGPFKTLSERR